MHTTVLLGTRKCDQSAWRMASNQRFLSSLDREKPWEKSEGLALPRLKKRGTQQWSLNDIPKQKKTKAPMRNTHNAAESRLRCPEPRSRAIIVQMVYYQHPLCHVVFCVDWKGMHLNFTKQWTICFVAYGWGFGWVDKAQYLPIG